MEAEFRIKDTTYNGYKVTYLYHYGKKSVEIWHPNEWHTDFHIEFNHTTITGYTDFNKAIVKGTELMKEYPWL